jgi:hypothetical protein
MNTINNGKMLIFLFLTCFIIVSFTVSCSKKEAPVLRAFDDKNDKMIVLRGEQTKIKNFYEKADFVVVGSSLGGIAAALALCSNGREVILVEESDKIAGCFAEDDTLSFAEGELVEKTGSSRASQIFRSKIRDWYKKNLFHPHPFHLNSIQPWEIFGSAIFASKPAPRWMSSMRCWKKTSKTEN